MINQDIQYAWKRPSHLSLSLSCSRIVCVCLCLKVATLLEFEAFGYLSKSWLSSFTLIVIFFREKILVFVTKWKGDAFFFLKL